MPARGLPRHARSESAPISGEERLARIALAAVPGVGPAGFAAIVERYGGARAALMVPAEEIATLLRRVERDTIPALRRLGGGMAGEIGQRLVSAAEAAGGAVITDVDASYPPMLLRAGPRPPVLYLLGDLEALNGSAVAIVGMRHPTGRGRMAAMEIADELARAGVIVVSGLALGIDGAAHEAAVDAGGRTVAVLPSPIDRVYPPRHRSLAGRIAATGGAVISEMPPGRLTGKPDFARRNRIIAGLSRAVVVVEAPDRSGALLTASAALVLGRELYAVPGPIDAVASRGCNRLIADHQAELVTSAVALVQRLGLAALPATSSTLNVATLSDAEGLVLGALLKRSGSIEELASRVDLGTSMLASVLTLLEARGLVTSYGGVTFHPTAAIRRMGLRGAGA